MTEGRLFTNSVLVRGSTRIDGLATMAVCSQPIRELARRVACGHTEALLDEALDETFPASDLIAIDSSKQDAK
ncbi:MAG: hypothetical protein ABIT64_03890 [Lysobacteraceae bacterium]